MPQCPWHTGRATALLLAALGLLAHSASAQTPPSTTTTGSSDITLKLTFVGKAEDVKVTTEAVGLVNQLLQETWKANKITPSKYIDDYEFIRRASLDIIGRVAKPEEIAKYLKYPKDRLRSQVVEDLLASDEYPKHWADLWSHWLLTRSGSFGKGKYKEELQSWLEDQFASNKPYNDIVTKLLTASGKNTDANNGSVNFILAHVGEAIPAADRREKGQFEMVPITSRVTRLFLGMQLQCAQCHDHPFHNAVKQKDFWGINAFFRQVEREGTPPPPDTRRMQTPAPLTLKENTATNKDGAVFFEKRNGVLLEAKAVFFDSKKYDPKGPPRREQLADFLIEHENFPRAAVNRMWGVFFGRGFTNPIDDFNEQNAPSIPKLLNELAVRFKQYNYNPKYLIRWMTLSDAYQRSYAANKTNDKQEHEALFSRMMLKAMSPEQMIESLMQATNAEAAESKETKGRLRQAWLDSLIGNFGDDEGNEVNFNGTVVQALMMMNGKDINDAITRKDKGTVAVAMKKNANKPEGIIRDLYLATLGRPPRPDEVKGLLTKMALDPLKPAVKDKDMAAPYQDLLWALLNSNEFLLNH